MIRAYRAARVLGLSRVRAVKWAVVIVALRVRRAIKATIRPRLSDGQR
jgi:hypothetical protein